MKRIVVFALVLNAALLGVIAHQLVAIAGGGAVATQNGDTNGDGARDITDAVYLLSWLFQGGTEPVALAQQGGDDEAIEELRAQIVELQSSSRLANAAIVSNMDAIAGLRENLHPVAFSGNYEELENVPVAQGGDCCESNCSQLSANGDMRNADLSGVDLSGCDLSSMLFDNTNLSGADLSGANLQSALLWEADLTGANLENANLVNATFKCSGGRRWLGNEFDCGDGREPGAVFQDANLRGAVLLNQSFYSFNMAGADFSGADLAFVSFELSNLEGVVMEATDLRMTDINDCNLSNANLQNVDLRGGSDGRIRNSDLRWADLRGANLQGGYFYGIDFTGADLTGANVEGAEFSNQTGLDLTGAIGRAILDE